ncbi:glycan biosynthesis hexose transferase WsfD [Paenibacillus sp. 2TAB19]|uniref:glycan biosynthesis hexose transferase WsfD n=1 Tax=Paenibacillus sp. 2TAB19 TaxID=3233003 RepID=UPI003F999751
MNKFRFTNEWAITLAAILILGGILMLGPIVGLADNGDFARIMWAGGIGYAEGESYQETYFGFAHTDYTYKKMLWSGYVSTQIIIVMIAGFIGRIINSSYFDIRVLSSMYSLLYAAALVIWMKYNKTRWPLLNGVIVVIATFVFLDIGYIAYFNSFFGEAVTLIFMLLTFGLALAVATSDTTARKLLLLFFIACFCLICTKLQNAPIGLLLILIAARFWALRKDKRWRKMILIGSSVLLIATAVMYIAAPQRLKHINLYQTVFYGILKDSPDPDGALKELGLPESFKVLAGTNYFQTDTAIKQNDPILTEYLYSKLSHKDVLLYYMKHPGRFLQKLERGAESGMSIRPYYLGSYDKDEGKPYGTIAYTFSLWSEFKHDFVPNKLWFVCLIYLVYYAGIVYEYTRRPAERQRARIDIFACLGLIGLFGMGVPLLGDGEADLGKHLFLFNVCFDMMLAVGVVYLLAILTSRVLSLRTIGGRETP